MSFVNVVYTCIYVYVSSRCHVVNCTSDVSWIYVFSFCRVVIAQMDPSANQQQPLPMKHMMSVPEKIELTATGAYPSPQASGLQDTRVYRGMRVPDKITLETAEEGEEGGREGGEGEGEGGRGRQGAGVSGGLGGYFQQPQ